jgi:hypothetical protein
MKLKPTILWKKLSTLEYNARYSRLAGEIECYKPQIEKRLLEDKGNNTEWADQAKNLIKKSEDFLNEYKIDEAWKTFHTARRLEVFAMMEEEQSDLANELRMETSKLNEWRREAILELIGRTKADTIKPPAHRALFRAIELKDEHYNNQYYKNRLSQRLFNSLCILLILTIVVIAWYFWKFLNFPPEKFPGNLTLWEYLIGVLLFGILGATTSAILFTRYLSRYSRITEIGSSKVITFSKIFVGAAFTVFIFLLLRSSLAESINLFSFTISNPIDFFAIAFVSGFSERLAQNAIEKIVGKEKEDDTKTTERHET